MITVYLFITLIISGFSFSLIAPLDVRRLNYFTYIFYLQFCTMSLVGVYLISNNWDYDPIIKIVSEENKLQASILVLYAIAAFSISLSFFSIGLGRNRQFFINYTMKPLSTNNKQLYSYFKVLLYISFILAIYFFNRIGNIPFIESILKGLDAHETTKYRTEWVFNLTPSLQLIRLVLTPLSQIIYFFFIIEWFSNKSSISRIIKALFSFFLALAFMMYGGDKAPVVFFLLGHFMLMVLLGKRFSFFVTSCVGLGAIVLISSIYFLLMKVNGSDTLMALINRVFVSQISGTYLAFQHFGSIDDFLGFSSQNASLIRLFGEEPALRVSERLIEYYYPYAYSSGFWKNTNSLFIHEAWGNFGLFGALIAPIWCALLISLNFFVLTQIDKTSFSVAFLAYASYATITLSSSFNSYIFSVQFVILFFIFLIGYGLSRYHVTFNNSVMNPN